MIAAGYKDFVYHFDETYWKLSITNIWAIELPMSLAVVATNWNKPMHEYLKKCKLAAAVNGKLLKLCGFLLQMSTDYGCHQESFALCF